MCAVVSWTYVCFYFVAKIVLGDNYLKLRFARGLIHVRIYPHIAFVKVYSIVVTKECTCIQIPAKIFETQDGGGSYGTELRPQCGDDSISRCEAPKTQHIEHVLRCYLTCLLHLDHDS